MSAVILQLTRQLVAREFHQHRAMLLLATLAGLGALVVAASGPVAFNVGFLVWLTALIALAVLLAHSVLSIASITDPSTSTNAPCAER